MKRNEVDKNLTWNLSDLFKTEEDYKKALNEIVEKTDELVKVYEGKLDCYCTINSCLDDLKPIYELIDLTGNYAALDYETDLGGKEQFERIVNYENTIAPVYAKLSFVETEILANDKRIIEKAMKENSENRRFLEKLLDRKDHTLSKEVEGTLSALAGSFETPFRVYNQSKMQDLSFEDVEVNGVKTPMTYNVFEGSYEVKADTEFRRDAFKKFYKTLEKYENTFASTYYSNVHHDKAMSKVRKYDSVFDYLLASQKVTREMYNRQCDVIMEKLAPHIRKYARLLKRVNKLDKMTFSDMKMPLDSEFQKIYSVEDCKNMVIDGLSVLGSDYKEYLEKAFNNRYIDYVDNEGKSSGAFCASPYKVHPYILLTWTGNMSDILTVAHELGHGGHFSLTHQNQNILNVDCSTYFVEAPSTTNELIMAHYLLEKANTDRERRWIISEIISKTYYHNFVTHFLEAYYQREVYKIIDNGGAVDAETLNTIFKETMEKFFGEDVELVDGVERTWMRQPHYYMGLYSYTYSAGLTIGTQMCLNILKDNSKAEQWIEVLKSGGSKNPIDLAKMADVDVTTDAPLLNTIEYIGSLIDEMERLTDKIEQE